MADDWPDEDGARPGPSTDPKYTYTTDYDTDADVDNLLDMLDNAEKKSEDDFIESEDEGFGSQEKEAEEEKVKTKVKVEQEKPKDHVTFIEEVPVKEAEVVNTSTATLTRRPKKDFRGTKSAALARQRLAHKQTKIAILKVHCGKCPWEHTVMKFAEDLTELDLPNVVKYIEGAENVASFMLGIGREEAFQRQYHPLNFDYNSMKEKERELRRVDKRIKEEEKKKMEKKQKKEFEKIKSALKVRKVEGSETSKAEEEQDIPPSTESIADRRESDAQTIPQFEMSERSSSRSSSEVSMSILDANRSPTKSFSISTARLEEERERQRTLDERLDKLMSEFNRQSMTSFVSEKSGKSRKSREKSGKSLKSFKSRKSGKSREFSLKPLSGKPHTIETFAENETIIEDTFEGPGLSDDEDERYTYRGPLKSALRDRTSAATHATGFTFATNASRSQTAKASAITYASSNATTLLPRPVTVVFKGLHDSEPRPRERKGKGKDTRPKTDLPQIPRTAYSRTGMSKKSAKSTKVRRSHKEHRVAIVKQDCDKCAWEKKVMKYEEDLTDDERFNVERVFDRTVEKVDEETIC